MSTFLDIALPLAERGFRVFPLVAENKMPLKMSWGDHFDAATTDLAVLELWDKEVPRANVGLCPDENFCFLETDSEAELKALCPDVPPEAWDTARVSSGRPDRCYFIFRQTMRTRKAGNMTASREDKDNLFEFKQHRVYVVGPGSIHPKRNPETGNHYVYAAEWCNIPAMPDVLLNRLCELYGAPKATDSNTMSDEVKRETATLDRFLARYEVPALGDWFNKGKSWYRPIECPWVDQHENLNQGSSTCVVFTEGGGYGFDCKHRCADRGWKEFRSEVEGRFPDRRFSFVEQTPQVIMGSSQAGPSKPTDWRAWFHSRDEMRNAPPISFLIQGFLQREGVTAIAGPVRERKSIIAINVVHALLTGEKLFDHFEVVQKPERVLYLCPEVSLGPFTERIKKIGLMDYVGNSLFCRTLSAEGILKLEEPGIREALPGSVVFLDTAIRFLEGKENDSGDVRRLADSIFALLRDGAESVVLLHHSAKDKGDALTLENALRGSGDMGAFLASCWGTRLQDPSKPYESPSYLENLKQRDFESKPFEVTSGPDYRLHIVPSSLGAAQLTSNQFKGNKDGQDSLADEAIRAHKNLPVRKLQEHLASIGIKRGTTWISKRRAALGISGVVVREGTA